MRTWLPQYSMERAASLDDALGRLASQPGRWTPIAGGTDLMVVLETGRLPPRHFLDISSISELRGIHVSDRHVRIGALTTYTELLEHSVITTEFPLIAEAARQTGAIAIQNRGTVGGNIANASPAADLPPALLVYDAEIELISIRGTRRLEYRDFHTAYKKMDLVPDELISGVTVPRPQGVWRETYRKVGTRRAQAISKVCFAARLQVADGHVSTIRIALGSVAPTVMRANYAEAALIGESPGNRVVRLTAREALEAHIEPIDDIRSSAAYRRRVAGNLLEEFLG